MAKMNIKEFVEFLRNMIGASEHSQGSGMRGKLF